MSRLHFRVAVTLLGAIVGGVLGANAYAQVGKGAGQGAAVGAFLGLVLGDDLGDVVEGAGVGAAGGAVVGAMTKPDKGRAAEQAELERLRAQEQARRDAEAKAAKSAASTSSLSDEQAWVAAIGEDNLNGLQALIKCEHQRAAVLANAGALSAVPDHRLASVWLHAVIAVDQRDSDKANSFFNDLVGVDPDIDSAQQAGIEADKVVLDVRAERRQLGISCGT